MNFTTMKNKGEKAMEKIKKNLKTFGNFMVEIEYTSTGKTIEECFFTILERKINRQE